VIASERDDHAATIAAGPAGDQRRMRGRL
jgi:hypothetical protein